MLAYKFNHKLLPFALFSPITLLAVERGNIDGFTFFTAFAPILLFRSNIAVGFSLGIATALKIFPIFGYAALLKKRLPYFNWGTLVGAILALPLALPSLLEIGRLIDGTIYGFGAAYGLTSIKFASPLRSHGTLALAAIAIMAAISVSVMIYGARNKALRTEAILYLADLRPEARVVLTVSLCIFFFTYVLLTSWAYRLIFLLPAFFVLSKASSGLIRAIYWNIFALLWVPMIPVYGWWVQNLACFSLAPLVGLLLLIIFKEEWSSGNASFVQPVKLA